MNIVVKIIGAMFLFAGFYLHAEVDSEEAMGKFEKEKLAAQEKCDFEINRLCPGGGSGDRSAIRACIEGKFDSLSLECGRLVERGLRRGKIVDKITL